jgi:hypothetical protein
VLQVLLVNHEQQQLCAASGSSLKAACYSLKRGLAARAARSGAIELVRAAGADKDYDAHVDAHDMTADNVMSVPVLRTPLETPCAPNPDVAVSADAAHPDVVAVIQV